MGHPDLQVCIVQSGGACVTTKMMIIVLADPPTHFFGQ